MKIDWYTKTSDEAIKELNSDINQGLSNQEANNRLKKYGYNKIPEKQPLSGVKLFLSQFADPLIYILVIAAIVSLFLKAYSDAIIISIAVIINTIIGYIQENKASSALKELKKIIKQEATVLRDGRKIQILQENIVIGDILILNPGDKVAADARLLECKELEINEAALTGESESAKKYLHKIKPDTPLADRDNMVYMGTSVDNGYGKAIVTATGVNTEFGNIAKIIKNTQEEKTPFQKKDD